MAATTFALVMKPFTWLSVCHQLTWTFWPGLILAGITWPFLIILPDALPSVLLHREAKKVLQDTCNQEVVALCELEERGARRYGHRCSDETISDAHLRIYRPV